MATGKLTMGNKLGYSFGSITRIGENVFYLYFILFLTTVIGIPPAIAGTISLVAILWDAVTDPLVGYFSDNSKSRYGKRRPFMLAASIPLALSVWLLFVQVELGLTGNIIFYTIIGMLFWTFYTMFLIPYDSFGAELTEDYTERATIRSYCTGAIYISVILGGSGIILLKGFFNKTMNYSDAISWNYTAAIAALVILAVTLVTWRVTRGKEAVNVANIVTESIIKSYKEIFKLKPFRSLALMGVAYFAANSMIATATIYLAIYKLGASEATISMLILVMSLAVFVSLPFANKLIEKFGKKKSMIYSLMFFIIVAIIIYVKGVNSVIDAYVIMVAFSMTNTVVLNASFSMPYDLGELSEFRTGKSRAVALFAMFSFAMKAGQAIGQWLIGILLQYAGFDGMVYEQTEKANNMIVGMSTIIPSILIVLAFIAILFYKLDKKQHAALLNAISLKKQGKEYSTEGIEELL